MRKTKPKNDVALVVRELDGKIVSLVKLRELRKLMKTHPKLIKQKKIAA